MSGSRVVVAFEYFPFASQIKQKPKYHHHASDRSWRIVLATHRGDHLGNCGGRHLIET